MLWLLANWKWLGALILGLGLFSGGVWLEHEFSQVSSLKAQVTQETTDATQAHQALLLTQQAMNTQQGIVDEYDRVKDLPDPVSTGILTRLQIIAAACPVLPAPPDPGRAPAASGVPGGDAATAGLLEHASRSLEACHRDATRLDTLIQLEKSICTSPGTKGC